jgi:hypothetical protein
MYELEWTSLVIAVCAGIISLLAIRLPVKVINLNKNVKR